MYNHSEWVFCVEVIYYVYFVYIFATLMTHCCTFIQRKFLESSVVKHHLNHYQNFIKDMFDISKELQKIWMSETVYAFKIEKE
jgi:hypothetical protein